MTYDVELNEIEYVMYNILFSTDDYFRIELEWCDDLSFLVKYVHDIEAMIGSTKLTIIEHELILTIKEKCWYIKLDRQNE
jgi:hypothetical protein